MIFSSLCSIDQHAYSGSFCEGSGALLQDLMTKAHIRSNLTRFAPDIAATRAQGLDYVMGETNSFACHGAPGVSNVAGAALWTLDYLLYGYGKVFVHGNSCLMGLLAHKSEYRAFFSTKASASSTIW